MVGELQVEKYSEESSIRTYVRTYFTRKLIQLARQWYSKWGLQYALWKVLRFVFVNRKHGVRFKDLHRIHCLILGRNVRKNATWKALNTLAKKGLVKSVNGVYYPIVLDEEVVKGSIDFKRVRTRTSKRKIEAKGVQVEEREAIPQPARKVISKVEELIKKGDKWKAIDLIAHTLLPVRQTGVLLAKHGNMFIWCERKTGFMHYVVSEKLSMLWKQLGLPEGYLGLHRRSEADSLVRRLFGSHDIARRVHYMLKEMGWFQYGPPLFYELYEYDDDGGHSIAIYRYVKKHKQEEKDVEDYEEERKVILVIESKRRKRKKAGKRRIKAGVVLPMEHIKEENEETYFNRSKGMF